ncbi:hypothetical protein SAPIO_CDS7509 [Scedosporium apiospermum]|uniref:Bis(5'-adenosyl)-triphosphatase n=1 Tax=Pseudallescheria apiosperma TaxID=563466 RepID=A0A084G224_PSEDA|nr:uncharacterized protein SAPIO_CDS7509 [Scedosporium apiospermum]KEZ41386.1 hypothetical protein SAPIO_CDS7509 [Scedosporium apiospermum]
MSTSTSAQIHFGPFEVFLTTPHSFALVNLKPLLPGHVLVCPLTRHKRLTDLTTPEITDLFTTVQLVQRLLARYYFRPTPTSTGATIPAPPEEGSFNIALQDGSEAGQTVPHVHVHVIPRIRDVSAKDPSGEGDALYERMAAEEGNIGGALWDRVALEGRERPVAGGGFARIEDALRQGRSLEDMVREVEEYKKVLRDMGA